MRMRCCAINYPSVTYCNNEATNGTLCAHHAERFAAKRAREEAERNSRNPVAIDKLCALVESILDRSRCRYSITESDGGSVYYMVEDCKVRVADHERLTWDSDSWPDLSLVVGMTDDEVRARLCRKLGIPLTTVEPPEPPKKGKPMLTCPIGHTNTSDPKHWTLEYLHPKPKRPKSEPAASISIGRGITLRVGNKYEVRQPAAVVDGHQVVLPYTFVGTVDAGTIGGKAGHIAYKFRNPENRFRYVLQVERIKSEVQS